MEKQRQSEGLALNLQFVCALGFLHEMTGLRSRRGFLEPQLLHFGRNTLCGNLAILLGQIEVDVMTAGPLGDCRHGASAAERVEHNVAPVAVEFDQPVNQLFRERSGMAVGTRDEGRGSRAGGGC
jgi:hypothetical protein